MTVDFDIVYNVDFKEEGIVNFRYRKDAYHNNGFNFGVFKFIVDDVLRYADDLPSKVDWQTNGGYKIHKGKH